MDNELKSNALGMGSKGQFELRKTIIRMVKDGKQGKEKGQTCCSVRKQCLIQCDKIIFRIAAAMRRIKKILPIGDGTAIACAFIATELQACHQNKAACFRRLESV